MKIKIESSGEVRGTRIWIDDVEVTNRCRKVVFLHRAADIPHLRLDLNLLNDKGRPFLSGDDVASEYIRT